MAMKLFRWKAIVPLVLVIGLIVVLWMLFADRIIRSAIESTASATLGSEVDLAMFRLRETDLAMDMGGLQIANPSNPLKNLFEAGTIVVDLAGVPLTEKKFVVERVALTGLRFGTTRKTPARPASKDSPSRQLWEETRRWAQQSFSMPSLALARVDSAKNLVLNPTQLESVKAAEALASTVDSTRTALTQNLEAINIKPVVDSSNALASRLAKADPKKLGVAGAATAVADVKRQIDRINQAKKQLETLGKTATSSLGVLNDGLKGLDAARQRDYALARSLLSLPSLDAPNISQAMFGQQSTDYFQQALYYAQLAQKYLPPGLQPTRRTAPKRLRMDGVDVDVPKEHAYPQFLLERGDLDLAFGADTSAGQIRAVLTGFTTQPAIYGKPATLAANGTIAAARPIKVDVKGLSDHIGAVPKDRVQAALAGVPLPSFSIPNLPFSVNPGAGSAGLTFALEGDRISGRWELSSNQATWSTDSGRAASFGLVENTIWRVVSGLSALQVRADIGGTVAKPELRISSNLDDAIASRLKAIAGEEVAKAELKARAAVDRLVDEKTEPLKTKVGELQQKAASQLGLDQKQLDDVQKQLEAQLKRYGGGVTGGIKLPKL